MRPNSNQLSALSRLFSPRLIREIAQKGRSPLFARLIDQSGILRSTNTDMHVSHAFVSAFETLRTSGLRSEYVYKAAIANNILIGRHSLNTASMLTEFRIGPSKADLVILNGTGTVYEIKSERDSLARLPSQLENYRKAFARTYVISGENHLDQIMDSVDDSVGILSLERWNRIKTIRAAEDNFQYICPRTILASLRINEARTILENANITIPEVPNTLVRHTMENLFEKLDPISLHTSLVETLKLTRSVRTLSPALSSYPKELRPVILETKLRPNEHARLIQIMDTPIVDALKWN